MPPRASTSRCRWCRWPPREAVEGRRFWTLRIFANGTWITDLVFVNLSIQPSGPSLSPFDLAILPSRAAIYFYDTEGNPIDPTSVVELTGDLEVTEDGALTVQTEMEPMGVLTISTHGRGELVTGSVRVVSAGPIGGMLCFDHPALGAAGVGASPPVSDVIFPGVAPGREGSRRGSRSTTWNRVRGWCAAN